MAWAVIPPTMTLNITTRLNWEKVDSAISSRAKVMPARGVLKAAAIPAALPATKKALKSIAPKYLWDCLANQLKTDEAIWTVGPSLPIEAPPRMPTVVERTLKKAVFNDTNGLNRVSVFPGLDFSIALRTCGMPLPFASGANPTTNQVEATKRMGVDINTQNGCSSKR